MRVAFIFTHRIQYFTNPLDELHRRGVVEPAAIYGRETSNLLDSGFNRKISWDNRTSTSFREFVLESKPGQEETANLDGQFNNLPAVLTHLKPDCIHLNGYADAIQWRAWLWACRNRVPIFLRGDGDTLRPTSVARSLPRNLVSRLFTRAATRVFYQGAENRKFWLARGAAPDKLRWLPCVSDTTIFHQRAFPDSVRRQNFRAAHQASPHDLVFVVSGKLDKRKRPNDALDLLAVRGCPENIKIWFLGSGPLEPELKARSQALGLAERVRWWGFRNQTEMPQILQAADGLLHLSEADPWPYSVLDAAASGLALLLSDRTGSYPDWLEKPNACLVFPHGNIAELTQAVNQLASNRELLQQLRDSAFARARLYTEAEFCRRFEQEIISISGTGNHTPLESADAAFATPLGASAEHESLPTSRS